MDLWDQLSFYLGVSPVGAVAVVVSTMVLYLVFAAVLRRGGQRLFSSPSSLDVAVVAVLGAMVGRAILGHVPTLAGGLLALATLLLLETVVGRVRRSDRLEVGWLRSDPARAVALMVAGRVDTDELHRQHLTTVDLWSVLRCHGVRRPEEVALVLLEPSGRFSVLRAGEEVHPDVLTGVRRSRAVWEALTASGQDGTRDTEGAG